jgi:hypothetical protein
MSTKHINKIVFICDRCNCESSIEFEANKIEPHADHTPQGWHWFENPINRGMTNFCQDCAIDFKRFMEKK